MVLKLIRVVSHAPPMWVVIYHGEEVDSGDIRKDMLQKAKILKQSYQDEEVLLEKREAKEVILF